MMNFINFIDEFYQWCFFSSQVSVGAAAPPLSITTIQKVQTD